MLGWRTYRRVSQIIVLLAILAFFSPAIAQCPPPDCYVVMNGGCYMYCGGDALNMSWIVYYCFSCWCNQTISCGCCWFT